MFTPADPSAEFDSAQLEHSLDLLGKEAVIEVVRRFEALAGEFILLSGGGDPGALVTAAHGIAGCARYIGLCRLGQSCKEVELAGRKGDHAAMVEAAGQARGMLETGLATVLSHPGLAPDAP